MSDRLKSIVICMVLLGAFFSISTTWVLADGTETLGVPLNIAIASGTGIVANGTGLLTQPGTISLYVPLGTTVKQVLLYWEGQNRAPGGDDTINIDNGTSGDKIVTGVRIGGPTYFFQGSASGLSFNVYSSTYRKDITDLGLIHTGQNTITVEGLTFDNANNGAGIIVIYDDGINSSNITLKDGNDLSCYDNSIYHVCQPTLDTTVEQIFTFPAATYARTASLKMFFSSVEGAASGFGPLRPSAIKITVGSGTPYYENNLLYSNNGEEWDTLKLDVQIPAGVASLKVQALSVDLLETGKKPASFAWNAAALSVPMPQDGCSLTLGYWKTHANPLENKYDHTWDSVGPGSPFVDSSASTGKTWLEMLSLPTTGRPYVILARQWIAVYLNRANGASIAAVQSEFDQAEALLRANAGNWQNPAINIGSLSEKLDNYNNGITGPGHCN